MVKSGFAGSHPVVKLLERAPGPRPDQKAHRGAQRAGHIATEEFSRWSEAKTFFALTLEYAESNQRLEKARQRADVRANFAREVLRAERAVIQVIRDPELGRYIKNL